MNSLSFTALTDITYSVYCIARFECTILLQMAHRVTLNQKSAVTAYPVSDFNSAQNLKQVKSNQIDGLCFAFFEDKGKIFQRPMRVQIYQDVANEVRVLGKTKKSTSP